MEGTLKQNPLGKIRLTSLYESYAGWCRDNGQYPESTRGFQRNLERAGVHIEKGRPTGGGTPTTIVIGYDWIPVSDLIA